MLRILARRPVVAGALTAVGLAGGIAYKVRPDEPPAQVSTSCHWITPTVGEPMIPATMPLPEQFAPLKVQARRRLDERALRPSPELRFVNDAESILAQLRQDYGSLVADAARVVLSDYPLDGRRQFYEVAVCYQGHRTIRLKYSANQYRPGWHQIPYLHEGKTAQFSLDLPHEFPNGEGREYVYDDPDGDDVFDIALYLAEEHPPPAPECGPPVPMDAIPLNVVIPAPPTIHLDPRPEWPAGYHRIPVDPDDDF